MIAGRDWKPIGMSSQLTRAGYEMVLRYAPLAPKTFDGGGQRIERVIRTPGLLVRSRIGVSVGALTSIT
jgi:hypothetical protein